MEQPRQRPVEVVRVSKVCVDLISKELRDFATLDEYWKDLDTPPLNLLRHRELEFFRDPLRSNRVVRQNSRHEIRLVNRSRYLANQRVSNLQLGFVDPHLHAVGRESLRELPREELVLGAVAKEN